MKSICQFIVLVVFASLILGCKNRDSLNEQMSNYCSEYTKRYCPIEYGRLMSLTKMEFDEGRFIYTIVVNDSIPGAGAYFKETNMDDVGNSMLYIFASLLKDEEKELWINNEYGMIFKCISKQNGKINLIDLPTEKIKKAFESSVPSKITLARETVRNALLLQKRNLPIRLGKSELLTNVSFWGDKALYEVDIEDNETTVLEKRKHIMREGLLYNLSKQFHGTEDLVNSYILGDIAIEYLYTGTKSGTTCAIVITPEDLKGLIN